MLTVISGYQPSYGAVSGAPPAGAYQPGAPGYPPAGAYQPGAPGYPPAGAYQPGAPGYPPAGGYDPKKPAGAYPPGPYPPQPSYPPSSHPPPAGAVPSYGQGQNSQTNVIVHPTQSVVVVGGCPACRVSFRECSETFCMKLRHLSVLSLRFM